MSIIKNETNLTEQQILSAVAKHQEFFAGLGLGSPETEAFRVAEDGHLVGTSSIYAPIVIRN